VHESSLDFISTPGTFLYPLLIYFKLSMIKIGCFWVSTILSLICIIPQNLLLVGFSILFGLWFLDVINFWIVHFSAVTMPKFFLD